LMVPAPQPQRTLARASVLPSARNPR
jgi:hypothetical protein